MAYRSKEQLLEKAQKMQTYLEAEIESEPAALLNRLELLSILIAQSGQCLAEAKFIQDQIINAGLLVAMEQGLDKKLSPSLISKFVSTQAKEVNFLVNSFDRINSASVHQLDGIRSILSYKKAELNL